jgi:hypothetical protein
MRKEMNFISKLNSFCVFEQGLRFHLPCADPEMVREFLKMKTKQSEKRQLQRLAAAKRDSDKFDEPRSEMSAAAVRDRSPLAIRQPDQVSIPTSSSQNKFRGKENTTDRLALKLTLL